MQKLKKHIAIFLLSVFSLASLPPSMWHSAFANHVDKEDNYCDYHHKNAGTHIEEQQTHCDAFKVNTPLYDAVKVTSKLEAFLIITSVYKEGKISSYSFETPIHVSSRGPPAC